MPDPYKDEEIEIENRLCLFDVVGITIRNRCTNCPGRATLQHRLCPRKPLQPNSFRSEDRDRNALKSLASSSKQPESGHNEADTVLPDKFARLSLIESAGTAGTFDRSESDLDIPGGRAELSGSPRIPHGVKRKAELEYREAKYKKKEFDHLSPQEYLESKPLKPFRDLESGNLFMPGCRRIPSDEMTALLMHSSAASPMDTQEDRPSSSRAFVAGCWMNTGRDEYGLLACNDGIETEGCEELACLEEMES